MSGKTTYCTPQQVIAAARGIDRDDNTTAAGRILSSLGTDEQRDEYISLFLPEAYGQVNRWARRDFWHHSDVDVVLDGNGRDSLLLGNLGFWPLLEVNSVTVDDTLLDTDTYYVYLGSEARIEYQEQTVFTPPLPKRARYSYGLFTEGVQNVSLNISWGYEQVPADIVVAQALAALSSVLDAYPAIDDPRDPGIPAGVQSVTEAQFRVQHPPGGRYSTTARRFEARAKRICFAYQRAKLHTVQPPSV